MKHPVFATLRGGWLRGIKKRLLRRVNFSRAVEINGFAVRIPSVLGIRCRFTEPWMIDILQVLISLKEGAFLDVGVNIGQTLLKLKSVDSTVAYIGFEPNPACVFYVDELIRQNGFENCTIVPVGLFTSNEVCPLNFFTDSTVGSSPSIIPDHRSEDKILSTRLVPVFQFDRIEYVLQIREVALVKIDVEGAELEVIKSLAGLIRRCRPFVLLEVLPDYSGENAARTARQKELDQFFETIDYRLFRVATTGEGKFFELVAIEKIPSHSDVRQSDYLVAPSELASLLQCKNSSPGLVAQRS